MARAAGRALPLSCDFSRTGWRRRRRRRQACLEKLRAFYAPDTALSSETSRPTSATSPLAGARFARVCQVDAPCDAVALSFPSDQGVRRGAQVFSQLVVEPPFWPRPKFITIERGHRVNLAARFPFRDPLGRLASSGVIDFQPHWWAGKLGEN